MQKIYLMVLSASLVACSGVPEFPQFDPKAVIPSRNKMFNCKIIDKEKMLFECEKTSQPIDSNIDGYFCVSPEQTRDVIKWAQDVKKEYEKNCGFTAYR